MPQNLVAKVQEIRECTERFLAPTTPRLSDSQDEEQPSGSSSVQPCISPTAMATLVLAPLKTRFMAYIQQYGRWFRQTNQVGKVHILSARESFSNFLPAVVGTLAIQCKRRDYRNELTCIARTGGNSNHG